MPNGALSNALIINYSALPTRRVDFTFGVDYDTDVDKAKAVLLQIAQNQSSLLADQPVVCELASFGDSSINLVLRFWVKSSDYWSTVFAVNKEVNDAFREHGIIIPYPQLTVSTKKEK